MFFTLGLFFNLYSTTQVNILIEEKLIIECSGGNFENFRKLVHLTSPIVFSIAFRMLGDEDQAKDVVQETMITIWQKIKRIRTSNSYRNWIYRIAVNKCYDQLRQRKRNPQIATDAYTWAMISNRFSVEPSAELENKELAQIIGLLTEKLSPRQKAVFILSEIEEMSSDEISEITGMHKSVIKSNLCHSRKKISGMIEKYM